MDLYHLVGLNLGNSSEYKSKHRYLSLASQVWRPLLFDHSQISTSFLPSWVIFFGLVFVAYTTEYSNIWKLLQGVEMVMKNRRMNALLFAWLLNDWIIDALIQWSDQLITTMYKGNWLIYWTTDWLTKQLTDGITAKLTPWVAEQVSFQPTARLIYLLTYWLMYRLMDLLTLCLTDWQADLLSNYLTGWLFNLLTD